MKSKISKIDVKEKNWLFSILNQTDTSTFEKKRIG